VHLPQLQKKKVVAIIGYFIFFSFIFSYRFFHRVTGRFVTRGVQQSDNTFFRKNPSWLITKNAVVSRDEFSSRFWAFRNKGSSKTRLKKIAGIFPQLPKKVPTGVTFFPPPPPCRYICRDPR
jgi:hypothetical protein